ncbi:MAG: hypothetical protein ABIA74_04855 [bacterium]
MKFNRKNKIKFLLVALPILIAIFLLVYFLFAWLKNVFTKNIFTKIVTPKTITWSVDEIYSEGEKKGLEKFVQENIESKAFESFDYANFYHRLKKDHKLVKKVEWDFSNPDYAQIKIYGIKPKYLINDKFILGNKKRLFDKVHFDNFSFDNITKINVANKFLGEKLDLNVYQFLNDSSTCNCWDKFDVFYFDKSKISLIPKDYSFEYLVNVDEDNFSNAEKFIFVNSIYNDLMQEWILNQRKNKKNVFAFDLRFGDKIYVRTLRRNALKHIKGGGDNGW